MDFPEGFTIAQSGVVIQTLGTKLGLAPSTLGGQAKAMQIVCDIADLGSETMQGKPAERLNKWLNYIASRIEDTGYFCGALSFADFAVVPFMLLLKQKKAAGKLA